ncbi:MAG TPA: hypothetical protein VGU44_02745 [Gammaproteobacteria bacterium]|nr:hypothetical protein [Gammaproteobacteria bacterium]
MNEPILADVSELLNQQLKVELALTRQRTILNLLLVQTNLGTYPSNELYNDLYVIDGLLEEAIAYVEKSKVSLQAYKEEAKDVDFC